MFIAGAPFDTGILCWRGLETGDAVIQALNSVHGAIPFLGLGLPGQIAPWGAVGPDVAGLTVVLNGEPNGASTRRWGRTLVFDSRGIVVIDRMDDLGQGWAVFHDPWPAVGDDDPTRKYSATATATAFDKNGRELATRTVSYP